MSALQSSEFAGTTGVPSGTVWRAPSAYVQGRARRGGWLLRSATAAAAALLVGGLAAQGLARWQRGRALRRVEAEPARQPGAEAAAHHLRQGAAVLSFSVLADSALEHYRGDFQNRAMFIAPTVAGLALASLLRSEARPREVGRGHTAVLATAALTGAVGACFHLYNLLKREGDFNWTNFFYSAPLGAPGAISIAGLLGLAAQRITCAQGEQLGSAAPMLLSLPAGRALGVFTSLGLIGNSAEVWLLHFRGAFQNPFMYVPVTVPPLAAAALALASLRPSAATERLARALLVGTAAVGVAGVGFHAYGINRNMGGWKNWSQMIQQGPPLPAPPSFTGTALAALGALRLIEEEK
jgi:hypothetical protein